MLAIELDGEHHFTEDGLRYDEQRTRYLNTLNIRVLRFENEEVFQSPEGLGHLPSSEGRSPAPACLSN